MSKKVLRRGRKTGWSSLLASGGGILRGAFFPKKKTKLKFNFKFGVSPRIGQVTYTVQSPIEPVTFHKLKDAKAFQQLLALSTNAYKSDIVRRELTEEGYEVM